jgi:hypothetical protein
MYHRTWPCNRIFMFYVYDEENKLSENKLLCSILYASKL